MAMCRMIRRLVLYLTFLALIVPVLLYFADIGRAPIDAITMQVNQPERESLHFFDCINVCPPFKWSSWSVCTKRCNGGVHRRYAMYAALCLENASHCNNNMKEEIPCNNKPCAAPHDDYGGPYGIPQLPDDQLNPAMLQDESSDLCNGLLSEYSTVFNNIVTGQAHSSYLVYTTGGGTFPYPGGVAGRFKGITTVFMLAVLLERAFLIDWRDPPGLEDYLQPSSFDWSTSLKDLELPPQEDYLDIGSWRAVAKNGFNETWYMNTNFAKVFTKPVEVIQSHNYDFTYALLRNKHLKQKAFELRMDLIHCHVCCTWKGLFTFNARFKDYMTRKLQTSLPSANHLGSLQLRTENLLNSQQVKEVISCCQQVLHRHPSIEKIILISNNKMAKTFLEGIKDIVELKEDIDGFMHIHLGSKRVPRDEAEVHHKVQDLTFQHLYLLLDSALLVRLSGYKASLGIFADALRRYTRHGEGTYIASQNHCTYIGMNYTGPLY